MKVQFFKRDLVRRSTFVFIAGFSASIVAFFANIIISKTLGPQTFGTFKTVLYLFAFLPTLVEFGINSTLTKYIAEFRDENKTKHLIKWFLKIKALSYIILIALILLFKDFIALYFLKDVSLNYLVLAGVVFTISTFFSTFNFIVLGFQNFKLFSLCQFLSLALSDIFSVFLIPFGIFYMILGWGVGPLIGNIASISFLLKKRGSMPNEKADEKKIFFKFSLPIYPIELSTTVFNAVVPLLSLFFSTALMGYYSFAFMFYYAANLIPGSLSLVLFPKVSELNGLGDYKRAKNILMKFFLYYGLFLIIGVILLFLLSDWFISFIAKDYLPSVFMFKVIVTLSLLFGFNVIYTNYLKGLGRVKRYAFFVLLQNILLITVSFILLGFLS